MVGNKYISENNLGLEKFIDVVFFMVIFFF